MEKGKIIVKKAYADWTRFAEYKRAFHESAIELIEIPKRGMTGKNSADIRLAWTPWTCPTPRSTSTPS